MSAPLKPGWVSFGKTSVEVDHYATQGNAILGIRGSGKSYTATCIAEQLMAGGVPITALDPIGVWRYLAVPAKQGGKAFPIVVCGGEQPDVPLTVENAETVMRAAMRAGVSVVFDLYDAKLSKRQWRDIVCAVTKTMLYENGAYGARHVFIEEAAEFAPQQIRPDQGAVFDQIERLVRMGGNKQLGVTLVNQRAEQLNKGVLDLCDLLILHRQKGRNSLKNLAHWMELASVTTGKEVSSIVPILKNGEAFIWEAESDTPTRTTIPAKQTFHPDRRAMTKVTVPDRVDTDAFVAKLRVELEKIKPAANVTTVGQPSVGTAYVYTKQQLADEYKRGVGDGDVLGYQRGVKDAMHRMAAVLQPIQTKLSDIRNKVADVEGDILPAVEALKSVAENFGTSVVAHPAVKAAQREVNRAARTSATIAGCPFPKAERLILTALRQYHPQAIGLARLAVLTQYARNGGGFKNALGALRSGALVTLGDPAQLTEKGMEAIEPYYEPLPTGSALLEHWLSGLDKAAKLILGEAAKVYPGTLTKGQLAARAGYDANGGGFKNALGRLRTLELVKGRADIKASEVFFQ